MKAFLLLLALFGFQAAFAGGNTSVVQVSAVKEITITEECILIRGDALTTARVETDDTHGDSSVYGRPAQTMVIRSFDGQFEIVPYFSARDQSTTTGGRKENLQELGKSWWIEIVAEARKLKVGDAVTISYQDEQMTIADFKITRIVGAGTVRVTSPPMKTAPKKAK